jgi:nitronate monooxygenase
MSLHSTALSTRETSTAATGDDRRCCLSSIRILQGGMGVAVSGWRLARAVSEAGQLGVVSGTALDVVLARRLQLGDGDGSLRRSMTRFPVPGVAERILRRYHVPGGLSPEAPFLGTPMPALRPSKLSLELTVLGAFVEVDLAREGHYGPVGINLLEKIQLPTLPTLFGAMLAGVDVVLMGAGIPRAIPGVLEGLASGATVVLPVTTVGGPPGESVEARFDPWEFCGGTPPPLRRPLFFPIVSSLSLATMLLRRSRGSIDGFVVEGPTAGGHNAPPRGAPTFSPGGEPVYGPRDIVDPADFRELGLPWWMAGSQATPRRLAEAMAAGARGIQVGTAFAYCEESGLPPALKAQVLDRVRTGEARVRTDPRASPTGFPFKILEVHGTVSEAEVHTARRRVCDLGYLRTAHVDGTGVLRWRCPAEPVERYLSKGGTEEETVGRFCVCNGLTATVGLGQRRKNGATEPALVTSGDDLESVLRFLPEGCSTYRAADVVRGLLGAG